MFRQKYVYTDLAIEAAKGFEGGFVCEKKHIEKSNVDITKIQIDTKEASKRIGRAIGNYVTIEAKRLQKYDEGYHRDISYELSKIVLEFLPKNCNTILVVGLGNEEATPDALGPKVVSHLHITRNVLDENGGISAISPGVMAQTGMEVSEIVMGINKEIKPDVVIVVDALSARNVSRIGCTIQITDTGICPGSGVGNYRKELTKKTLNVPVIAIGIPTVVCASAIVCDTLEAISSEMLEEEKIRQLLEKHTPTLYVTPKDIDELIERLSYTISEGLNIAFMKLS